MGFRFSGLGRPLNAGQIYCHATAPQTTKPNAALIPNKTGDGMIDPFRCNSYYHFLKCVELLKFIGSFLNARKCLVMRSFAPRSAEQGDAPWPSSLIGRAISQ